jgi:hypothetical protein
MTCGLLATMRSTCGECTLEDGPFARLEFAVLGEAVDEEQQFGSGGQSLHSIN